MVKGFNVFTNIAVPLIGHAIIIVILYFDGVLLLEFCLSNSTK